MNPSKVKFVNNVQLGPCAAVYYGTSFHEFCNHFELQKLLRKMAFDKARKKVCRNAAI